MTDTRHRCPCCMKTVTRTRLHHISGHFDKAGNICPASYASYDITLIDETHSEAI